MGQGTKSYLDACGWSGCNSGVWAVQTNTSPNRDSGTGTWEIVSATGTNVGGKEIKMILISSHSYEMSRQFKQK